MTAAPLHTRSSPLGAAQVWQRSRALQTAILGWLLLTASAVHAGHPLVTDDAGTASPL